MTVYEICAILATACLVLVSLHVVNLLKDARTSVRELNRMNGEINELLESTKHVLSTLTKQVETTVSVFRKFQYGSDLIKKIKNKHSR